jgi:hypothetical protein
MIVNSLSLHVLATIMNAVGCEQTVPEEERR